MPIKQMEAVAEQQMVKAVLPFMVAGIIAVVGWLFSTVMELEKTAGIYWRNGSILRFRSNNAERAPRAIRSRQRSIDETSDT